MEDNVHLSNHLLFSVLQRLSIEADDSPGIRDGGKRPYVISNLYTATSSSPTELYPSFPPEVDKAVEVFEEEDTVCPYCGIINPLIEKRGSTLFRVTYCQQCGAPLPRRKKEEERIVEVEDYVGETEKALAEFGRAWKSFVLTLLEELRINWLVATLANLLEKVSRSR